ncbi:MAG: DUF202 domain-containing protein [Gemmatimonadota bacterium]
MPNLPVYEDGDTDSGNGGSGLQNILAIDRTTLANERTLLAYVRTALQCMVGGVSLLKFFFDQRAAVIMGWVFLLAGAVLMIVGIVLFFRRRSALQQMHGPGTNHLGIQH